MSLVSATNERTVEWTAHATGPAAWARLARHDSTRSLERDPFYREQARDIWRTLDSVTVYPTPANRAPVRDGFRAVAWNVERGLRLDAILDALTRDPRLAGADLYLLTELDVGMARSGNRDVPGEIAARLGFGGVFAPCYLNLGKGSGVERDAAAENRVGVHGNALFSRWPIRDAALVRLPNGKDKMRGPEKRIGSQAAALATIELPGGPFAVASVHLDAHSTRGHRRRQMARVLDALDRRAPLPALVGGDWNTSTHNTNRALWAILGFWVRVAMGVGRCLREHYPHPDRFFERRLFRMLERRGFDYRALNAPGVATLEHQILAEKDRRNLADWLPTWCLAHVERELKPFDNCARLKLDWFAGRGVAPIADCPPQVIAGLSAGSAKMSDHDPIALDFTLHRS